MLHYVYGGRCMCTVAGTTAHTDGRDRELTALDNHQPYLDELRRRAGAAGVAERIRPCCMDTYDRFSAYYGYEFFLMRR